MLYLAGYIIAAAVVAAALVVIVMMCAPKLRRKPLYAGCVGCTGCPAGSCSPENCSDKR